MFCVVFQFEFDDFRFLLHFCCLYAMLLAYDHLTFCTQFYLVDEATKENYPRLLTDVSDFLEGVSTDTA